MQGEEVKRIAMKHILDDIVSATFEHFLNLFVHVVDFLLKLPDICDKLGENLKMKANRDLREYSLELRLPGKVPSARMQSFVVSVINEEEVKSFGDFYVFSRIFWNCQHLVSFWTPRRHPLVISCELEKEVINFVDYSLIQGAPAGHESVETPIGHESNGAVVGEGVKSIPDPPSQQSSSLEQAIANLNKVVGDFVGNQEATNAQINQRIDSGEYFE
ncbi:hypothetical protein AAG906_005965 [Vitis piasezkii]